MKGIMLDEFRNHPLNPDLRKKVLGPAIQLNHACDTTLAEANPHTAGVLQRLATVIDEIWEACRWEELNNADGSLLSTDQLDRTRHSLQLQMDENGGED